MLNGSNYLEKHDKIALMFWFVIVLFACAKAAFLPDYKSVSSIYFYAGEKWHLNQEVYGSGGHGFLYLPIFAFLMSKLYFMGLYYEVILWKLVSSIVYASGAYYFCKYFRTIKASAFFLQVSVFAIPFSYSSFCNGQATLILLGICLWICIAVYKRLWSTASILLSLGLVVKPTFIPFFLIFGTLYKPLWIRLIIGIITILFLPIIFSNHQYAISQYLSLLNKWQLAIATGESHPVFAHILNAWEFLTGIKISHHLQTLIRIFAGFGTFALCLRSRCIQSHKPAIITLFILVSCYTLLFNPRTENTNYLFAGFIYGLLFGYAYATKKYAMTIGITILFVVSKLSHPIETFVYSRDYCFIRASMLAIFTIVFIICLFKRKNVLEAFHTNSP